VNNAVTVNVTGTDISFDAHPGETVLDAAERAGYRLPHSCRTGVCNSCDARLTSGAVSIRQQSLTGPADQVKLCLAQPLGPVEIAPVRISRAEPPTRRTMTTTVHRITPVTPDVTVVALRYPIGKRVKFRAGQYATIELPGGATRNYSLANAPQHNDSVQLHVRRVPGGRFSDRLLTTLRRGDELTVRLPFGEFTVDDCERPILLLVTGTGFAPARSIVEDLIHRGVRRPVHLYWGARHADELYQGELAAKWASRHDWFRFTPVLSRPRSRWDGATGYVQQVARTDHPDLAGHEIYACGNPAMTESARSHLAVAPENFHSDAFLPSG
jgi:CDP-4-dehydro-6-deoxyglucose reductase/3-phenylpropionate/trans-cinnamate dioxygenase ferredoxin reductase subunit